MAKAHILEGTGNEMYRVVFHVPIGAGNNAVNVAWTEAVARSSVGGKTILTTGTLAGQIAAAELAQIQAGTVVEIVRSLNLARVGSAKLTAYLQDEYASNVSDFLPELKNALRYWGGTAG